MIVFIYIFLFRSKMTASLVIINLVKRKVSFACIRIKYFLTRRYMPIIAFIYFYFLEIKWQRVRPRKVKKNKVLIKNRGVLK